ncbi:hypothetical protein [Komagataeibacter kakiaceti]|uniref:hypothetical protein n=1 Tax=Komagataeibacter kakiaceti TaxID=943261 RepID=UPI0018FFD0F3|nr:hypothetical protein [Komagataeibacter kakiaceti]
MAVRPVSAGRDSRRHGQGGVVGWCHEGCGLRGMTRWGWMESGGARAGSSAVPPHLPRYHTRMSHAPLPRLAARIVFGFLLALWLAIMAHDPVSLPF